jgi:hypothetical protein
MRNPPNLSVRATVPLQFGTYETGWYKENWLTRVVNWSIYQHLIPLFILFPIYEVSTDETAEFARRNFPPHLECLILLFDWFIVHSNFCSYISSQYGIVFRITAVLFPI